MDRQDKIIILLMLVVFGGSLIAGTILNAQRAEAEEQAQFQARAAQVESVKAYIQDCEDEEQTREATNQQIKAEKAEQARQEAARLEAERQEAERLAREQAEREAEQARQEAMRQAQLQQAQQVQAQAQNTATESATTPQSGVLTKDGGVNYYNGSRETWYSSNQLYHYRTNEWTAGADGVYRDKDGYVVVARSDMAQGATLETSLGTGKVYDSGCANGTTDIYTKW